MTPSEESWLAGLIEGEGCYYLHKRWIPQFVMNMTDEDVVRKAHAITGWGNIYVRHPKQENRKTFWAWMICDQRHVHELCQRMYPHMGSRRRAKICELFPEDFKGEEK